MPSGWSPTCWPSVRRQRVPGVSATVFRCGSIPSLWRPESTRLASHATTATVSPLWARTASRGAACSTSGAFDGFYSFLAEVRGARRVVAVDNEQYVDWVRARFGVTLPGGAGFRAVAELLASRVEYHRMDALDVRELGERFDVVLCMGILHRVTDPIVLLQTLADVLMPGGEVLLETYGSHLPGNTPAIEVHGPGDVYPRDNFLYWGFPIEGLRRLGRIVGLGDVEIIDQPEIDGHPRIIATLRATQRRDIGGSRGA